jgi:hypothetical protein
MIMLFISIRTSSGWTYVISLPVNPNVFNVLLVEDLAVGYCPGHITKAVGIVQDIFRYCSRVIQLSNHVCPSYLSVGSVDTVFARLPLNQEARLTSCQPDFANPGS